MYIQRMLTVIISVLTIIPIYLICRRLFNWKIALIGSAIFVFITINMFMVLGMLPIVGSPLPIMSYGGSSMLATMVGFGIVLSAKIHSQQSIA